MNDTNDPTPNPESVASPSSGRVMDVQSPTVQPRPVTEAASAPPSDNTRVETSIPTDAVTSAPETSPSPAEPSPQPIVAAPADPSVVTAKQPEENPVSTPVAPESSEHDEVRPLLAAHAPQKQRRFRPVVLVAVVLASALIAVAVFAYTQSQQDNHDGHAPNTTESPMTNTDSTKTNATKTEALEQAGAEVDNALEMNDAEDLSESGLTDQDLGL